MSSFNRKSLNSRTFLLSSLLLLLLQQQQVKAGGGSATTSLLRGGSLQKLQQMLMQPTQLLSDPFEDWVKFLNQAYTSQDSNCVIDSNAESLITTVSCRVDDDELPRHPDVVTKDETKEDYGTQMIVQAHGLFHNEHHDHYHSFPRLETLTMCHPETSCHSLSIFNSSNPESSISLLVDYSDVLWKSFGGNCSQTTEQYGYPPRPTLILKCTRTASREQVTLHAYADEATTPTLRARSSNSKQVDFSAFTPQELTFCRTLPDSMSSGSGNMRGSYHEQQMACHTLELDILRRQTVDEEEEDISFLFR